MDKNPDQSYNKFTLSQTAVGDFVLGYSAKEQFVINNAKAPTPHSKYYVQPVAFSEYSFPYYELKDPSNQV
jgi:hypothetical protein